uniref:HD domain-containing protein n=1 Tax=Cyprinus carpio TaxID=7962 RepID=A0A8C1QBM7_CYPCA
MLIKSWSDYNQNSFLYLYVKDLHNQPREKKCCFNSYLLKKQLQLIFLNSKLIQISITLFWNCSLLRHLKQLGALSLVYPGGTHTRFEHSLGVAYLAGCLVKTLDINQPELNITPGDMLCVQIAGLCHDLGHGPLSHLFDGKFIASTRPGKFKSFSHEKGSIDLFRNLVEDNGLREEMENYGLNPGEDLLNAIYERPIKSVCGCV